MKKSFILFLHLGFWLLFFFLMAAMAFMAMGVDEDPQAFAHYFELLVGFILIPCLVAFYGFYYWIFPNYAQKSKWWETLFYGFLMSIGGAMVGLFFLVQLSTIDNSIHEECVQQGMVFTTLIAFACGFIALVIRGFITWIDELKLKEALIQKNHEMEIDLVKAQLDPHFLFNTINNIDVLILKDANEASRYLNKLSDIMRFMLFETKPEKIALSKEVEYIEKYIELQKIRTTNKNYINFSITGNPEHKMIAPMVFIPFIENAFKHTTNKKIENAINISIQIEGDFVKLTCGNKYNPNRTSKNGSNGLGNDLIKKRLNLIYPVHHDLVVNKDNDTYEVNLTINNG